MTLLHFFNRHIGVTKQTELIEMYKVCNIRGLYELTNQVIPNTKKFNLKYRPPIPEHKAVNDIKKLLNTNRKYTSLIGLGYYNTHLPFPIKRHILENPKWYTAYTPYQSEISQGRLEAQHNFQDMIKSLTNMEISNSSLLDESTAAVETLNMCYNIEKKSRTTFICSNTMHPQVLETLKTKSKLLNINLIITNFNNLTNDELTDTFGIMYQYPDTYGKINMHENLLDYANSNNILLTCSVNLMSLTLLKPPGDLNIDICFGTAQQFGIPLWYGGPHPAFMACKHKYIRQLPGKLIGKSVDENNDEVYRLALQTREQHIKKDKATSNICTSQSRLATAAGFYGIYHGPDRLKDISRDIHNKAKLIKYGLLEIGIDTEYDNYFDTICIKPKYISKLEKKLINNNFFVRRDNDIITLTVDEKTEYDTCLKLLNIFSIFYNRNYLFEHSYISFLNKYDFINDLDTQIDMETMRTSSYMKEDVFNKYHTETELVRYIYNLSKKDYTLTEGMIPLGSCTMKLNSVSELEPLTWESVTDHHPYMKKEYVKGYTNVINELSNYLKDITGFNNISYQSNAGSMGEYSGLLCIKKYHEVNNQKRNVCLIPESAHGTNFSSAKLAGFVVVKFNNNDFEKLVDKYKNNLGCLMITYPNTNGIFQENIEYICDLIHSNGGLVYIDGANMNAQVGITNPALVGGDVCHLNLHKTFCIPHGGGGPGMGPILCNDKLKNYFPTNIFQESNKDINTIGSITSSDWSSASILTISYMYLKMMGTDNLKYATQIALLNSNYLKDSLKGDYKISDTNIHNRVGHEFIIDLSEFKNLNITEKDIAKRIIDYNFHPGTMSWPKPGVLMFEPTESESKFELDRLIDALTNIRKEIDEIKEGKYCLENNVIKNSPHCLKMIKNWKYDYSIEKAFYPSKYLDHNKYYPSTSRVNDLEGDRQLIKL